jgi:hypothetical protein
LNRDIAHDCKSFSMVSKVRRCYEAENSTS